MMCGIAPTRHFDALRTKAYASMFSVSRLSTAGQRQCMEEMPTLVANCHGLVQVKVVAKSD
jgi:hypothetical protein